MEMQSGPQNQHGISNPKINTAGYRKLYQGY